MPLKTTIVTLLCFFLLFSDHVHLLPQHNNPCSEKLNDVVHIVKKRNVPGFSAEDDCKFHMSHGSALGGGHDSVLVEKNENVNGFAQRNAGIDSSHDNLASKYNIDRALSTRYHFTPPDGYPVTFPVEGRPYEGDIIMHEDHDHEHAWEMAGNIVKGDSQAYTLCPGDLQSSDAETHDKHLQAEHALQDEVNHNLEKVALRRESDLQIQHHDGHHEEPHFQHHYEDHHYHYHDDDEHDQHKDHHKHEQHEQHDDNHSEHKYQHDDDELHHDDDHQHDDDQQHHGDHHHDDNHNYIENHHEDSYREGGHHHDDNEHHHTEHQDDKDDGHHHYEHHVYIDNNHHDSGGHENPHANQNDDHHPDHHLHDDNHHETDHHEEGEVRHQHQQQIDQYGDTNLLSNDDDIHPELHHDAVFHHSGQMHHQKEFSEEEKNPYHHYKAVDEHDEPTKDFGKVLLDIKDKLEKEEALRKHQVKDLMASNVEHHHNKDISNALQKIIDDAKILSEHLKSTKSHSELERTQSAHDSRTIEQPLLDNHKINEPIHEQHIINENAHDIRTIDKTPYNTRVIDKPNGSHEIKDLQHDSRTINEPKHDSDINKHIHDTDQPNSDNKSTEKSNYKTIHDSQSIHKPTRDSHTIGFVVANDRDAHAIRESDNHGDKQKTERSEHPKSRNQRDRNQNKLHEETIPLETDESTTNELRAPSKNQIALSKLKSNTKGKEEEIVQEMKADGFNFGSEFDKDKDETDNIQDKTHLKSKSSENNRKSRRQQGYSEGHFATNKSQSKLPPEETTRMTLEQKINGTVDETQKDDSRHSNMNEEKLNTPHHEGDSVLHEKHEPKVKEQLLKMLPERWNSYNLQKEQNDVKENSTKAVVDYGSVHDSVDEKIPSVKENFDLQFHIKHNIEDNLALLKFNHQKQKKERTFENPNDSNALPLAGDNKTNTTLQNSREAGSFPYQFSPVFDNSKTLPEEFDITSTPVNTGLRIKGTGYKEHGYLLDQSDMAFSNLKNQNKHGKPDDEDKLSDNDIMTFLGLQNTELLFNKPAKNKVKPFHGPKVLRTQAINDVFPENISNVDKNKVNEETQIRENLLNHLIVFIGKSPQNLQTLDKTTKLDILNNVNTFAIDVDGTKWPNKLLGDGIMSSNSNNKFDSNKNQDHLETILDSWPKQQNAINDETGIGNKSPQVQPYSKLVAQKLRENIDVKTFKQRNYATQENLKNKSKIQDNISILHENKIKSSNEEPKFKHGFHFSLEHHKNINDKDSKLKDNSKSLSDNKSNTDYNRSRLNDKSSLSNNRSNMDDDKSSLKNNATTNPQQSPALYHQISIISKALRDYHRASQLKTAALKQLIKTPLILISSKESKLVRRHTSKEQSEITALNPQETFVNKDYPEFYATTDAVDKQHYKMKDLGQFSDKNVKDLPAISHNHNIVSDKKNTNTDATTEKEELVFEKAKKNNIA